MAAKYETLTDLRIPKHCAFRKFVIRLFVISTFVTAALFFAFHLYPGQALQVKDEMRSSRCRLPILGMSVPSLDGSYTPPSPDHTLLAALDRASSKDYNNYCVQWDPETGFSEDHDEDQTDSEDCGTWQEKYTDIHQREISRLSQLKSGHLTSHPPQIVSYHCDENPTHQIKSGCGGLADRMTGMLSTFFYALLTDRAYLANWKAGAPIALEQLFDKPNIDWSYDPGQIGDLFGKPYQPSFETVNLVNLHREALLKTVFPTGVENGFSALWNASFVEMRSNRGFIIQTFNLSETYSNRLARLGLTEHNAVRCLSNYLFRPTFGSRQFIKAYKMLFGMKSVLSIGVQIRTNDTSLMDPNGDSNSLAQWSHFLNCANHLRDAKRQRHHKHVVYFLVTDSNRLRDEFVELNSNRTLARKYLGAKHADTSVVITGLPIKHIDADTVAKKALNDTTDDLTAGVHSAVIENWLLSSTDYRIISVQGYGKLAAFRAKNSNSTIQLNKSYDKGALPNDFCARPKAFTSFKELSLTWSLG